MGTGVVVTAAAGTLAWYPQSRRARRLARAHAKEEGIHDRPFQSPHRATVRPARAGR
ncbi:hypothetical protein BN2476_1240035 [Paraburkholderia piptadeniae]|uniref:Uncharacterized protein n=1 Tax=Paraburkholderia piptadeniae TaxID=1701573 RepID=A0A1N7SXD6_9BURK|nr:hypothetical protein BN2476_1240035 [Paraburkholderia piptadeniae]